MQLISPFKHLNKERVYSNSQIAFKSKLINNTLFNLYLIRMKKIYSLILALFFTASAFSIGHTVTATATGVTCFGTCNGTTMSIVGGGVGPFTYSWAPSGGTGAGASGLCAGTYTVTVTDNSDMSTATATVAVTSPTVLTITPSSMTSCVGSCVTLSPIVSGGTPPYTYNWSPPSGLSSSVIATPTACPAATTTYTVTVADANGCVQFASMTVTLNPVPTITASPSTTVCSGACASLTVTSTPGPATYVWIGPGAFVSTLANPVICPAVAGTYTVTGTYAGCTSTAITTITIGGAITSNITSTNTTGCITCDGTMMAAPTGGSSPYVYNWSTGAVTPAVVSTCAGTYSVTITDASGCTITDSTTIFSANDAIANFTMVPDSTDPYNFFAFNSSTGPSMTYLWDFGDGTNSSLAAPSHTFSAPGVYNVCLVAYSFICGSDTLCQPVTVTGVSTPCNALFNIADDTLNPDPNAHYVYNLSYGATLTYLWDFGDGTTSTSATPSHVYSGTGPYLLCLSIDNGAGCTDMFCDSLISADSLNRSSGTMQIVVYDVPTFYTSTAGITDVIEVGNVTIAPNPFNETAIFTVNSNETYSFELTDVLGKKVKSKTGILEKQFEISRDGLENGIYFYKIYTSERVVGIGKVVIK